jgi:hypothetical protein
MLTARRLALSSGGRRRGGALALHISCTSEWAGLSRCHYHHHFRCQHHLDPRALIFSPPSQRRGRCSFRFPSRLDFPGVTHMDIPTSQLSSSVAFVFSLWIGPVGGVLALDLLASR